MEKAVLPLENSLGGSIHRNYDLLLRHSLRIIAEVNLSINHCLMALPGTKIEELERVMSHPQALAQTEGYLMKLMSDKCPGRAGSSTFAYSLAAKLRLRTKPSFLFLFLFLFPSLPPSA